MICGLRVAVFSEEDGLNSNDYQETFGQGVESDGFLLFDNMKRHK